MPIEAARSFCPVIHSVPATNRLMQWCLIKPPAMSTVMVTLSVQGDGSASAISLFADSRITFPDRPLVPPKDNVQKIFPSERGGFALAYCGDVELGRSVTRHVMGDLDLILQADPNTEISRIAEVISSSIENCVAPLIVKRELAPFEYCFAHYRSPEVPRVTKFTWCLGRALNILNIELPLKTGVLAIMGSGSETLNVRLAGHASEANRRIAYYYQNFVDHLKMGKDPLTGGPPQMCTLNKDGCSPTILRFAGHYYLLGQPLGSASPIPSHFEVRDEIFRWVKIEKMRRDLQSQ